MFLKKKPVRLKKIRDSARGEDCTIESPWCNHDPATTVLAHYGEAGEKGTALKPDDTSAAYACNMCHDWLDGRFKPKEDPHAPFNGQSEMSKEWYWFRGMRRTWRRLIEKNVLT